MGDNQVGSESSRLVTVLGWSLIQFHVSCAGFDVPITSKSRCLLGDWNSAKEFGLEIYYLGIIQVQRLVKSKAYLSISRESITMEKSTRIMFWEVTLAKETREIKEVGSEYEEQKPKGKLLKGSSRQ